MAEISTFAQRFEFARARQHTLGTWQDDGALADHLGVAASQISAYKLRDEAPQAKRTLLIAKWCGVDPGWLAFGEESGAPRPEGFAMWLENRKKTAEPKPTPKLQPSPKRRPLGKAAPSPRKRASGE